MLIAVPAFLLTPKIAAAMGAEGELLEVSVTYGRIIFASTPFFALQMAFQSFFVVAEMPHLSLISSVVSGIANVILDYLLIVVFPLGVAGAAIATAIGQCIGGMLEIMVRGSVIYAFACPFMGVNFWGSSFFTALNNGAVSAAISFVRTLVFQLGAVLIIPALWGLDGIWMSVVVAELLAVAVTAAFLVTQRKKYGY